MYVYHEAFQAEAEQMWITQETSFFWHSIVVDTIEYLSKSKVSCEKLQGVQ